MFFVYIIYNECFRFPPSLEFGNYINRYKVSKFLRNDQIFIEKKEEINKKNRNLEKKAMKTLYILCFGL